MQYLVNIWSYFSVCYFSIFAINAFVNIASLAIVEAARTVSEQRFLVLFSVHSQIIKYASGCSCGHQLHCWCRYWICSVSSVRWITEKQTWPGDQSCASLWEESSIPRHEVHHFCYRTFYCFWEVFCFILPDLKTATFLMLKTSGSVNIFVFFPR